MPVFRRYIERDDSAVLITECQGPENSLIGGYVLLLTRRRLLVTRQSRISGRIRVYLDVPLNDLADVVWLAHDRQSALEFAATVGETRYRFLITSTHNRQLWRVGVHLNRLFGRVPAAA